MKRQAIQLAGRTIVVSLPSKWVKKYGVNKGDELNVETKDDSLIINCQKNLSPKTIKIDISGSNYSVTWHQIVSAYCKGFDELEILFNKSNMEDNKNDTSIKTVDAILKIVDSLIGIEVIRQGKNFCMVKEVSKVQKDEFDNILRRLFFLLGSIAEDSLEALKNNDKLALKNTLLLENNINKFSHYCLRILNKFFESEKKDFAFIIRALEMIGDKYCDLIVNTKFTKKDIELLKTFNLLLRKFQGTFYDLSNKNLNDFYNQMSIFKKFVTKQKYENKYVLIDILNLMMEVLNAKLLTKE